MGSYTARKMTQLGVIRQALGDSFGTFSFNLGQLPEAAALTSLFQQYRFDLAEVWLRPMFRANSILDEGATVLIPQLYIAADPNDGSSWSTINDALNASNVFQTDDARGVAFRLIPLPQLEVFSGGVAVPSGTSDAPIWCNCSDPGVRHYGVKYAITGSVGAGFQAWNVVSRYTVTFRGAR